jgi:hypothetical protein
MDLIIGRFLPPLNSSKTLGRVRRRDDNSRGKVRKVRADSSAKKKWKGRYDGPICRVQQWKDKDSHDDRDECQRSEGVQREGVRLVLPIL